MDRPWGPGLRILHDPGRGAPLAEVVFHDPYRPSTGRRGRLPFQGRHGLCLPPAWQFRLLSGRGPCRYHDKSPLVSEILHVLSPQWHLWRYKLKKEMFVAVEGLHTGQFVYAGAKASPG